ENDRRNMDASGNETPPSARHGQNDPAMALGRKSWLFCGSDRGGQRAAVLYSLIVSAKMNDIDPQVWLAHVLARLPAYPAHRIDDLLPWNWRPAKLRTQPAAA
ncbi:transposase domain-containing protein, partial [Mesorhizobium sp. M1406]|uniref:transposase domain-containing protein n=2 Tax=unclassified Mesorhizobium TaxID=325217 RepID=UPI003338CB07